MSKAKNVLASSLGPRETARAYLHFGGNGIFLYEYWPVFRAEVRNVVEGQGSTAGLYCKEV